MIKKIPAAKELKIGRFLLKYAEYEKEWRYMLYGAENKLFLKGEASSEETLIKEVKEFISNQHKLKMSQRSKGIPAAEEFAEALTAVNPSDNMWEVLKYHYRASEKKVSSRKLCEHIGFADLAAINMHYGALGHKVADYLNFVPPGRYHDGRVLWITCLTLNDVKIRDDDKGDYQHILRPEVSEALEILGMSKIRE